MRLYTFLTEEGKIIVQVRAETRDEAIVKASYNDHVIDWSTDSYSDSIDE